MKGFREESGLVLMNRPCALESCHPGDRGNMFFCNVIVNLQSYTLTLARRPSIIGMKTYINMDHTLVEGMGGGWSCLWIMLGGGLKY
jgi:hypothetical protein